MPSKCVTHSLTKANLLSPKRLLVSIARCTLAEKTVGTFTFVMSNPSFGCTKQIKMRLYSYTKKLVSLHLAECQTGAALFPDCLSFLNSQGLSLTPM